MLYMSAIVATCLAEFDGILTLQWGGSQPGRPFHPLGLLNAREDSSILNFFSNQIPKDWDCVEMPDNAQTGPASSLLSSPLRPHSPLPSVTICFHRVASTVQVHGECPE